MAITENLTHNELIILQRIAMRQRVQHGKVCIEMICVYGEVKEVFVKPEHRINVKISKIDMTIDSNN